MIGTWLYYSTRAGIKIASHDSLYNNVGVLSSCEPSPHLTFIVLSGDLYIKPKSRDLSSKVSKRQSLKELVMDENISRFQEMVDKGPYYSVEMIK